MTQSILKATQVEGLVSGLNAKQPTLVSGTNIKTVNGNSLLGSGNIEISSGGGGDISLPIAITDVSGLQISLDSKQPTLVSGTTIKTINGNSLLGSGNISTTPENVKPFFYVKDYGALGNGVANDTSAIQSAINAANAVGGVLYFHPGVYIVSSELTVNNTSDTDPYAPKMSIMGAGPSSTVIWGTSGDWSLMAFAGGASGSGMHSHQLVSNISFYKDTGGNALSLSNIAYACFQNVYFRGAKYGVYGTDVLSTSFYNCQFLWNSVAGARIERSSVSDGFQSGPNAINFHGCVFGNNGHFGGWFTDGGNINFHGGSVEGNGITGVDVFPRAGIYCINAGLESAVGLNVSGTYFEHNKGTADIWLANTSRSVANSISGATFNRISSTDFTTYNIYAEGASVITEIAIQGCGFKGFASYSPSSARPTLHKPYGHKVKFSWSGCYFASTSDSPIIRNWTADKLSYGVITSSGTIAGDSSYHNISSVTKIGTGRYQITYSDPSESVNPTVVANSLTGGFGYVFASNSTHCTIQTVNLSGTAVDSPFSFIVFG